MQQGDFQQLERWFERALACDAEERDALVRELTERDAELGRRLAAMLAADDQDADPVRGAIGTAVEENTRLPRTIGPFEVIRRLGAGGMGVVYLCRRRDHDFDQQVAVKRLGAAGDSDFARQRLRIERRVLAGLRHPNIAQLIDGGEDDDGTPYVAMEYVEGETIDRFAVRQALDVRGRVTLFLALCEALQFAHRNLVVHRDIKAANVQIDRHGQLKLLDFGIAKLLGEVEANTEVPTVAASMTPHYASPEQVRGEPVGPASDIYSMGVLLYELLSGRRPYEINTTRAAEVERIVCESAPPALPGRGMADLDSIVACAMHKDPARRYASAAEFGADLGRWLDGRPVHARADSALYRVQSLVRRHPFGAATTVLISVLLIGFGSVMAWQAGELAKQRDAAETEARVANETSDFLIELFAVSDPRESNPADVRARDLLEHAAERLPEQLASDPLGRARLMHVIGLAFSNLGDQDRGIELLSQALGLREIHAGPESPETADSLNRLGNIHRRFGRLVEAEPMLVRALQWRQANGPVDHDLADSYNNVGLLQNDLGHYIQAEQTLRRSIELHRRAGGPDTEQVTAPLHNLSLSLRRQGRLEEARTASMEALAIKRAAGDWSLSSVAVTLAALANIERERGELAAALAYSEESLGMREQVFGRDNVMIASGLVTHAEILAELDQSANAEALLREALALHDAAGTLDGLRAADARLALGRLLIGQARMDEARLELQPALASAARELPADSPELERFRAALDDASRPGRP